MVGRSAGQVSTEAGNALTFRTVLPLILAASLVLLSGCPGDPNPGEFPAGANETGVSEALVDTHDAKLTDLTSFTYVVTRDQLVSGELREVEYRLESDVDDGRYRSVTTVGDVTATSYYAEGTFYRKKANGTGTSYEVEDGEPAPTTHVRNFNARIEGLIDRANFTFQGSDETDGGQTQYVYTASDVSARFVTTLPASNASVELAVTRDGLVRRVQVEYDVLLDGETHRASFLVHLRNVNNTNVSRPAWVDDATRDAASLSLPSSRESIFEAQFNRESIDADSRSLPKR